MERREGGQGQEHKQSEAVEDKSAFNAIYGGLFAGLLGWLFDFLQTIHGYTICLLQMSSTEHYINHKNLDFYF